jgi:hypothetical protein
LGWFLACDKGGSSADGSKTANSTPTGDTQKYQDCYAVTDNSQCGAALDMAGQPLGCAVNTYVNRCVKTAHVNVVEGCYKRSVASGDAGDDCTNTTEAFARKTDGSVDFTKTQTVVCKQHSSSSFLCVIDGLENHATKCSEVSGDCKADSKILNLAGDGEIDGNCAINDYTRTCVDNSDMALPPDSCAKVAAIDKCEGLQLKEDDGSVRAVCRKTKDGKKCEDAPEQKLCTDNDSTHISVIAFYKKECPTTAIDKCRDGCEVKDNKCAPKEDSAIKTFLKNVCEGKGIYKVRSPAGTLVMGFYRCDNLIMKLAEKESPNICKDR